MTMCVKTASVVWSRGENELIRGENELIRGENELITDTTIIESTSVLKVPCT